MPETDLASCYFVIGVRPGASLYEVKTAFRALSARTHPDNFQIGSPEYIAAQETQKSGYRHDAAKALKACCFPGGYIGARYARTRSFSNG